MDSDERDELVTALVLEAGRLMEELTVDLALVLPREPHTRTVRLETIRRATADISALLHAAAAIDRTKGSMGR